MNPSPASSLTTPSSPPSTSRRLSSKMPATKTAAGHTRSPRSRYSLTYADWITRALMAAKDKCACLSDIYEWMSFNVPGLQEQRFLHSSKGWKNAVRHTLSINPRFQKLKRLGKPALWTLSEDYLRQAQALTKISMSIPSCRDGVDGQMETGPTGADSASSPGQSKISYAGKSTHSPCQSGALPDADMKMDQSYNQHLASLNMPLYRQHSQFHDQYRNTNFAPSASAMGLSQACDAAAAAGRTTFLSDLSALASLNALITANNECRDTVDPVRQAAMAAHGLAPAPSTVAASPPLVNFFNPSCPFSISRRGSGDSGISSISSSSGVSSSMGPNVVDSLRRFTQSVDVTTLSGLEATLVFPRPLPIQCLTDHKLLLASLIWPNPAASYLTS